MALVLFQHEPVSVNVNKLCFDEEQDIPNVLEKTRKSQSVTEWSRCEKCGVTGTYIECLRWGEVEAFGCFQLSRYDDRSVAPKELVQQSCNFT